MRALVGALVVFLLDPVRPRACAARRPRRAGRRPADTRATAIRAELAEVLLQSRQYDDAAREYRALLRLSRVESCRIA